MLFIISFAGSSFHALGQQDKTVVGISIGHPVPAKEAYSDLGWEREYGFRIGLYTQWYASSRLAIQIEIDHQRIYLHNPEDDMSSTGYYFNVIYAASKWNKFKFNPWFLAGIGVKFSPFSLTSKLGGGILYSLSPSLNLLGGFYLGPDPIICIDPFGHRFFASDVKYVALNIGLEYIF